MHDPTNCKIAKRFENRDVMIDLGWNSFISFIKMYHDYVQGGGSPQLREESQQLCVNLKASSKPLICFNDAEPFAML